jgi:hypothetical protein
VGDVIGGHLVSTGPKKLNRLRFTSKGGKAPSNDFRKACGDPEFGDDDES